MAVLLVGATLAWPAGGVTPAAASGASIYVSPSGNDSNSGSQAQPLRTLTHARDVARKLISGMNGDITINLEDGVYRLGQTLQLSPADSGVNGHDVVWRGAPGATAIISGAQRVSGWRLADSAHGIWSAHVPKSLRTRQIYVDGMRASLASGPAPAKLKKTGNGYAASNSSMSHWRNPSQIDFVYTAELGLMVEPICPVASIHGKSITMAEPCWANSNRRVDNLVGFGTLGAPAYVENAFELLRQPGQFYLDQRSHVLYYIPRSGQDMHTADVEAASLNTLVAGSGSAANPIHDISFNNLQFSYATWLQPGTPTGFSDIQSGYTITGKHGYATQGLCKFVSHGTCPYGSWSREPGSVQFRYDRNLTFAGDRFVHLGAAGLNLDDGTQGASISGSIFTDISGNGIEIGGVDQPVASGASQTTGNRVTDNYLFGLPVEFHGGVAVFFGYAANSTVSHNQIADVPYSGISMGWGGWPDKRGKPATRNYSHDNVVSDNLIFDFMQVLSDGGGMYTQGITGSSIANGEKVTGNVIYNQLAWGRALQSDDGATNVTYAGNVLYNDNYDWGSNHIDYASKKHGNDPQLIKGNYWQQGDPNSSRKGVVEKGNTIITGGGDAPSSIVDNAGIESQYRSILSWDDPGQTSPNPPERVQVLYAFHDRAYVTWRPSYASGNNPVGSYTISACRSGGVPQYPCRNPAVSPLTISASDFNQSGYAVVSGLSQGKAYSFTVTAGTSSGSSTPSVPSSVATVRGNGPSLPGKPKGLTARAGKKLVRLLWYAPASAKHQPVIGYAVTATGGFKTTVSGLRQLIVTNNGGRAVEVFGGLSSGQAYRFSVAAITPAGTGPASSASPVKP
ncbi:MAG TPA: right-handed parallel beta-helix repeat-containing protein, partial [Chloroflexota bacterium]|nr:right-handed parallel beta-helix repeat-containing protein [Chloroflexota bacterium]